MKALIAFLLLALPALPVAQAAELAGVLLYQPNDVLQARLGSVGPLAEYLKRVRSISDVSLNDAASEGVDLVIVIKPGSRSRVWVLSSLDAPPDRSELVKRIEAVVPPEVKDGAVALALRYSLNGFVRTSTDMPIPKEWREKVPKGTDAILVPDGFIPYVWPE